MSLYKGSTQIAGVQDLTTINERVGNCENNKVSTDHSNDTKPYLKTTYVSGTSGYRIWSDGYCEQWGIMAKGSSLSASTNWTSTISLLKEFTNINYNIQILAGYGTATSGSGGQEIRFFSVTTSSFVASLYNRNSSSSMAASLEIRWKVSGYLEDGQY